MKFQKMFGMLLISLFLVLTMSSVSVATEKSTKLDLKIKQMEEMDSKGINKHLDKKIAEYYKNNNVLDDSKITDLGSPEAKQFLKMIEKDMDKFDNKLNKSKSNKDSSGDIGTMSLGDEEPSGSNSINYSAFEDGDIIIVHDGSCVYGYFRHAGTYDDDVEEFVSAQKNDQGNGTGVIWEDKDWYRDNYDEAVGVWVPDLDNEMRNETRSMIIDYLKDQLGDPYGFTWFYDRDTWYCSKLPWVGWGEFYTDADLNEDSGLCVPDDIDESSDTRRFTSSD